MHNYKNLKSKLNSLFLKEISLRPYPSANRVLQIRKAPIALLLEMVPFVSVLSVIYLICIFIVGILDTEYLNSISGNGYLCFNILRLILLLELVRRYFNDVYKLDLNKMIQHSGMISLNYRISSIKYQDIREVKIEQTLSGRLLGYGDICIGTASSSQYEVILKSVFRPKILAEWVNQARTRDSNAAPLGGARGTTIEVLPASS